MSVSNVVKSIQDIMRKDAGVDGDAQRISQLVWMLFLKIFDDKEHELEMMDDNYKSPIPDRLRWRNWAENEEGITGDGLLDFINNDLFKALKELSIDEFSNGRGVIVMEVFADSYNYMKSGTLLRQVINKMNQIDFNKSEDKHIFNDIYEKILRDLQSAGNAGEFYTPRAVTQFMTDMTNPRLGEKVLDPACGTGGFLVCALENIRKQDVKNIEDRLIFQNSIVGIEKKALPYMLSMTNLILHNIDIPQIRHDNSLSRPIRSITNKSRVDVIITNPPFGGMEEDGIESNFPANFRTRETADLFLILVMSLLKDGGRAGIVLPDGFFFGEGMKTRLKEKLLEECNLHTIVRLPNGVFNPYTGIKTNLLFFTKGESTQNIWYYEHPYPKGVKSYNKTKPMRFEEFQTEIDWWGNEADSFATRVETEQSWKISIDDIKARNYNLDIKNPHIGEQINHDPDELLQKYAKQQQEISRLRDQLKAILAEALNNRGAV